MTTLIEKYFKHLVFSGLTLLTLSLYLLCKETPSYSLGLVCLFLGSALLSPFGE